MTLVSRFEAAILDPNNGILDPDEGPERQHHEFKSGLHGRKLDFDEIPTGSDLYEDWVAVNVNALHGRSVGNHTSLLAVVGVANGTNRLAKSVGAAMQKNGARYIETRKNEGEVFLDEELDEDISDLILLNGLVVVLEDVGTTGSTALRVARYIFEAGCKNTEVLFTWQRSEHLSAFDGEKDVAAASVIRHSLPVYSPDDCSLCREGSLFIPRAT